MLFFPLLSITIPATLLSLAGQSNLQVAVLGGGQGDGRQVSGCGGTDSCNDRGSRGVFGCGHRRKDLSQVSGHLVFESLLSAVFEFTVLLYTLRGPAFMASSTSCPVAANVLCGSSDIQRWFESPTLQGELASTCSCSLGA